MIPKSVLVCSGLVMIHFHGFPAVHAMTIDVGGAGALVAVGDTWSYHKGATAPSVPGDAWQEVGFDDSTWPTGPSGFGYADGDDATELPDMEATDSQPGYASVYLRKEFDLGAVPTGALELIVDYDDGFIAYLNGAEVKRSDNMLGMDPLHHTVINDNHEAGSPETFVLGEAGGFLQAGTNVLAVQGHNTSLTSSDFSLIPSLRKSSGIVRNGDTWIVDTPTPDLSGTIASALVVTVRVDGAPASYDSGSMQWSGAPSLSAGLHLVLVEGLDAGDNVVESATVEIVHVPAGNEISGAVPASVTWSGAVALDGAVSVAAGVVLTIAPGTYVVMKPGASLEVSGSLLAAGTESEPIQFTHYGDGTTWERIMFVDAGNSVLAHCIIEYSDCAGDHKDYYDDDGNDATPPPSRTYFQAVVAIASHVDIDDCLFRNLPDAGSSAEGDAIAIISDDPDVPGVATANIRRCEFIGIGQGVHTRYAYVLVEDCYFTGHHGDNDDIDLYGESTPPPLILNNVCINPGHDDMINPTRCSAILIGNVIAGSDDHGIVLRDKCNPILINNLIYNCASGGIAIQNQCNALLINNTIVDCGRGLRFFDHTGRWGAPYFLFPGSGSATMINGMIWNCPTTFTLEDSPYTGDMGSHLTVSHSNIEGGQTSGSVSTNSTLTWGGGMIDADPDFLDEAGGDFRLKSAAGRWDRATETWLADAMTSPCIDAGSDVRTTYPALARWLGVDFDGIPRPLDGDGNTSPGIDIGAHEVITETGDSSGDGIPDGWSFGHGLDPLDPGLASGNPDGDPLTTGGEWVADTDPTDPLSYFMANSELLTNSVVLDFDSSADRLYTLYTSGNLSDWMPVPGQVDVPGNGGAASLTGPRTGPQQFYRAGVRVP